MEEAQRRINEWTDGPLDLRNLGLSSLPDSIGNLTNLTDLWLFGNQLSSLPDSIGNLTNLTDLRLNGNQLSSLPDSIGNLTNLTDLWLNRNQLSSLPDSIGNLTNLTRLRLFGNQLSSLPDSIGNLTNLTDLLLDGNQLSSLPDSIGNLTNLTDLLLDGNQLSSLPDSIGNLTNLTNLRLDGNQLSSLPVSMTQLGALTSVDMTEQPTLASDGSLLLGGNRWSDAFRQAADEGIEALWEHLKNKDPEDDQEQVESPEEKPRHAVETLEGDAAVETQSALEEPTSELTRFLDDERIPLSLENEVFLRTQLDTIRPQLRLGEPDRFVVERCLALIVARLAEIGHVGEGARELLRELGAEPPELIETIIETMQAVTKEIIETWGQASAADPAGPIVSVGKQVDQLSESIGEVAASLEEVQADLDRKPDAPTGLSRVLKAGAATAGGAAGVGKAAELVVKYRVDQILIRFYEAIARFWEHWTPFI